MRVTENKGITLLYISNGIHFKLSSLSAEWNPKRVETLTCKS